MAIVTVKAPKFEDKEMVVLKSYIYRKKVNFTNLETGEEGTIYKFLTLISLVPASEFQTEVEIYKGRPMTNGTYVMVIGSMKGLISTNNKVNLFNYQKHIEAQGWQFVQTVPKSKGKSLDWIQKEAWWIIKHFNDKKPSKYQENWFSLKNSLEDMMEVEAHKKGGEERYNALLSVSIIMDTIENP